MNTRIVPLLLAAAAAAALAGCSGTGAASTPPVASSSSASSPGNTTDAVLPVDKNPIVNTSTAPGLSITYAAVEDNTDPDTGAPIDDRLQLALKNDTAADLTHIEVYYTMLDATTKATENYYADLGDLTLPAGQQTTIYFDNTGEKGHYPENKFSLYRSSKNEVQFTIEVSADGVKPAEAAAIKAPGTGEVPGE